MPLLVIKRQTFQNILPFQTKILRHNSCGNSSSNAIEKYSNNNQGRFHTLTVEYSNGIEFAESEKNIKRTEEVFVHSNVKYERYAF